MTSPTTRLRESLAGGSQRTLNTYAVVFAFATYFCMNAFRKPFAAAPYSDFAFEFFGTQLQLKTALVISQILGYASSKALGIKFCSEANRGQRALLLIAMIAIAELALVFFAVLPEKWKVVALFLNGMPLGMVWGLVVRYLEGRRASEILLAGLSCSFIVSSGALKDVGRALLAGDQPSLFGVPFPSPFSTVSEFWMPAATGLLFLLPFVASVLFLNCLPEPSAADELARTARRTMDHEKRWQFLRLYLPGMAMLIAGYVLLTAFRDYRDVYMVDVFTELGYPYEQNKSLVTNMEVGVAFGVLAALGLLSFVKDNRRGLLATLVVIGGGMALVGIATVLWKTGVIGDVAWMTLLGLGTFLAYVSYNSILFDRLMASTRFVGTAVFAIYVADTLAYGGSITVQLYKDLASHASTRSSFLESYAYVVSVLGTILTISSGVYFLRLRSEPETHR